MSRVRVAAVAGLLGLALTGCGAGQTAATARNLPSAPGVDMQDAGVAVRNATILFDPAGYQPGDTVPVRLAIFNENAEPVRLVEISSEQAASVTIGDAMATTPDGVITSVSGPRLEVPGYGYVDATLELTGVREALDAASAVPLRLGFDNDATFEMNVPVAPPLERVGPREPIEFDDGH